MRYRYRPSKPAAIFTAIVGVGMLFFGISHFHDFGSFTILWCAVLIGIIGMNLWSAFSPRGSMGTWERVDDDESDGPERFSYTRRRH
jgi:hypothetical protein